MPNINQEDLDKAIDLIDDLERRFGYSGHSQLEFNLKEVLEILKPRKYSLHEVNRFFITTRLKISWLSRFGEPRTLIPVSGSMKQKLIEAFKTKEVLIDDRTDMSDVFFAFLDEVGLKGPLQDIDDIIGESKLLESDRLVIVDTSREVWNLWLA